MKSPAFFLLALVLAFGIEVRAQGEATNNSVSSNPCERYKIGIITPTKDIDFMITIIVPQKIDQAMIVNPCPAEQQQVAAAPQSAMPPFAPQTIGSAAEPNAFFKVPPFTIRNRYSH